MTEQTMTAWAEQTRAFYADRGIGGRVGVGERPAIVIVDMTKAFTNPEHPVGADQSLVVVAIANLLTAARSRDVPVFYTTLAFDSGGRDAGVWGQKLTALLSLRLDDTVAVEIDERIAPAPGEVVLNKRAPSAFFGTGLTSLLVAARIDTVVVTGCSTSGCIRATVVDAVSYGYRVVVPADCVSDRAQGPHEANLFDIDTKYGDVMALSDVTAYLEQLPTSGQPGEGQEQ